MDIWQTALSVILSLTAIGLSILFYGWGRQLNRETTNIVAEIRAYVQDINRNQYDLIREAVRELLRMNLEGNAKDKRAWGPMEEENVDQLASGIYEKIRALGARGRGRDQD